MILYFPRSTINIRIFSCFLLSIIRFTSSTCVIGVKFLSSYPQTVHYFSNLIFFSLKYFLTKSANLVLIKAKPFAPVLIKALVAIKYLLLIIYIFTLKLSFSFSNSLFRFNVLRSILVLRIETFSRLSLLLSYLSFLWLVSGP
jgi:hypothetical protein